jgi:hypothetical protein
LAASISPTGRELRTPRAAAIAGIVFAVLLGTALVLLRLASGSGGSAAQWLGNHRQRAIVAIALNLVPFAGIAFLWFIGVARDRIGALEDKFFATVFLGSGLLFVAMLFVDAAVAGGVLVYAAVHTPGPSREVLVVSRQITYSLLNVFAMRMAAVFTISTVTMSLRLGVIPRWLGVFGYATAFVLLVTIGITPWVTLLFPLWILLFSIDTLITNMRSSRPGPAVAGEQAAPEPG